MRTDSRVTLLYQEIAQLIGALRRCEETAKLAIAKHKARLYDIERNWLPSGSGIDTGTKLDLDKSTDDKIVLHFSFHHMDENGYYCGWTEHTVIITPTFDGFRIRITGRDRHDIKDYFHDVYHTALTAVSSFFCDACKHFQYVKYPTPFNYQPVLTCGHNEPIHWPIIDLEKITPTFEEASNA